MLSITAGKKGTCAIHFTCCSYNFQIQSKGETYERTRMSFLICRFLCPCGSALVSLLLLGHLVPLGSLGDIYSAMERRRRRRRAHGASFTITWKFPARSRIRWTLYPELGLILAVPRESPSVTEQIIVYCFLSRQDQC